MPAEAAPLSPQVVAIVDDDAAIRAALARLVRTLGYRPATFASAEDFLLAIAALPPACLLTDIQMPGMNGLELAREVHRRVPALPILVMTAYPGRAPVPASALDHMTKPLDDAQLERWLFGAIGAPPAL